MPKVMVKHAEPSKASKSRRSFHSNPFPIQALVACVSPIPRATELAGESVRATFDSTHIQRPVDWKVPPHLRLANLPTYDEQGSMRLVTPDPQRVGDKAMFGADLPLRVDRKAVQSFIREYGLLRSTQRSPLEEELRSGRVVYREDIAAYSGAQDTLRKAGPATLYPFKSSRRALAEALISLSPKPDQLE